MALAASPTLLVLAAGMGSRYGGLKQIDPVGPNGETIIDYSVYDAVRAGFAKLVFVIRRDIERQFRKVVGARFERHIAVEYAFQSLDDLPAGLHAPEGRTKPWGTAHAVLSGAGAVREPFAVINADDFYGAEAYRLLAAHLGSGTQDYAMAGFVLRNTLSAFGAVARGVCTVTGDGLMQDVVELLQIERDGAQARNREADGRMTALTGDETVSMNMWGFTPRIFDQLRERFRQFLQERGSDLRAEFYIPSAVNELVAAGDARVRVLPTGGSWFGVTYREDRAHVAASIGSLIREGYYPESLWS